MTTNNEEILRRLDELEEEMKLLKKQQAALLARQAVVKQPESIVRNESIQARERQEIPKARAFEEPTETIKPQVVAQPKKEFNLEKALSRWLPRVFMFILLLGVLWGLKVGMDNGYITNPVRVVMGYVGTVFLYYVGMNYYRKQNAVFGLTLLGGFIALGILTTFAAHHLYGYFNFIIAFMIGIFYIVAGLWLSERTKSETLTLFSGIAGFLLPFLLEGEGATALQFCLYIILLFLSLFYVSLRQQHKYTFYITFLLFHMTLLVYGFLDGVAGDGKIIVGTVVIQHLALLLFYLKGKVSRNVFSEALIYSNFAFTLGWIKILNANEEIVMYGLFALLYVGITLSAFKKNEELLRGVFSAVAVLAVSAFLLSFRFDNENMPLILMLMNGTVGLWVGFRYNVLRTIVTSSLIYGISALSVLSLIDMYSFFSLEHAAWLVFLATLAFIYYTIYTVTPPFLQKHMVGVDQSLIIAQLISLNYIFKLTSLALQNTAYGYAVSNHLYGLVFIVTLSVMYAVHKWKKGKYIAHAVVIEYLLLGILILPNGLSDSLDKIGFYFNFAVELLYISVLLLMFIAIMKGRFYLQTARLKSSIPTLAIVMQIVSFIYLNKWYFSIASHFEWEVEYALLIHTFLLFIFSFASISIGRKLSWKSVVIIGAFLILIGVLKLFIIDLGSVSILLRAILFTIVGVAGLLYSRTLFKD